ncbi:hypothetical protein, partial [Photobacterium sp. 53610]|uniref:hypothetical protein n=1 Tax=Photobacterium sp. 53610 TaxID=3102789 RepID=UPI002EDA9F31
RHEDFQSSALPTELSRQRSAIKRVLALIVNTFFQKKVRFLIACSLFARYGAASSNFHAFRQKVITLSQIFPLLKSFW